MLYLQDGRTADRIVRRHKDRYTRQDENNDTVKVVNRKHEEYLSNSGLASLFIQHNLDLCNDIHAEKFVRKEAATLGTGSIALVKTISDKPEIGRV